MNWMYYIANHGRPSAVVFPPADPFASSSTAMNVLMLSLFMLTHPERGTSGRTWHQGLDAWLKHRRVPAIALLFTVEDDSWILFDRLQQCAAAGGLLTIARGRYYKINGEYFRAGGHALTVVGLSSTSAGKQIVVHDPAQDDRDPEAQSSPKKSTGKLTPTFGKFDGTLATMLRWGSSESPYEFIDHVMIIFPLFAVTNLSGGALTVYSASLTSDAVDARAIPTPLSAGIADLAIQPAMRVAALGEGSGDVVAVDLISGDSRRLARLPGARRLTYGGRSRRLFVAQDRHVVALDDRGTEVSRAALDRPIDALAFDAAENRLIVASVSAGKLLRFSPELRHHGSHELPHVPGQGRLSLTVDEGDGALRLTRAGSPHVAELQVHPTDPGLPGVTPLRSGGVVPVERVKERGTLHVSAAGRIATFDRDGERVEGSPFNGLPAGPLLEVARSYSNADPEKMRRPEWHNR
ncbi:hypothetical protein SCE1572_16190 [Sorangium cellulosum So0157-2]|uniref:Uncharacterized protein n=2 Tax=Sorangium cellulosum TaxID=56 RepID=S4XRU9_SORCE|nr:hypothetical protein SCE1572_16190 [Sorangium cellulosum So0157-2]